VKRREEGEKAALDKHQAKRKRLQLIEEKHQKYRRKRKKYNKSTAAHWRRVSATWRNGGVKSHRRKRQRRRI